MYKKWQGLCLCGAEEEMPAESVPVAEPFAPLVFLVRRSGLHSRGLFAITTLEELTETEGVMCLTATTPCTKGLLAQLVSEHGATVLNTAFANAFRVLETYLYPKREGFRVTLVGLGDVGGTLLTGLKLLGHEIEEIAIYDPNEAMCRRYEMELNQVLPERAGERMPRVTICREEDLFSCDLFVFTASRGVPVVGSGVQDVRMAQFAANRMMVADYAKRAREAGFTGQFCQISDPVDHLSREVFLCSNCNEAGQMDFAGLLPEQVQGFGLGVMAARAAYYAQREGVTFTDGRVYGPHGQGLVVANRANEGYDDQISCHLTELTRTANLEVRALGFKPYIAPGLSSAAISLLQLLRGEEHYGAIPLGGVYFGCRSRMTRQGLLLRRESICQPLLVRLEETYRALQAFDYR